MTLQELKELVEEASGLENINSGTRVTSYVYARGVFFSIGVKQGYSMREMALYLGYKQHNTVINSLENHKDYLLRGSYRNLYEIVYERVYGERAFNKVVIPHQIINKLSLMTEEQLKEFDKLKLVPHLKMLKII